MDEGVQKMGCMGILLFCGLLVLLFGMWGCPQYNVWQAGLSGQAELRRAEQNRQIAIEEAKAKKESAQCLADAEIIRAEGVAKANKIIGDSLKGNEAYLRYLWIDGLNNNQQNVRVKNPAYRSNKKSMQRETFIYKNKTKITSHCI